MLIILPAILLVAFLLWALFRPTKGGDDSQYAKTRHFMDFDHGVDTDKIGDPKYPTAGIDSEMKHEFMEALMNDDPK